jgi:hypothetical protein
MSRSSDRGGCKVDILESRAALTSRLAATHEHDVVQDMLGSGGTVLRYLTNDTSFVGAGHGGRKGRALRPLWK